MPQHSVDKGQTSKVEDDQSMFNVQKEARKIEDYLCCKVNSCFDNGESSCDFSSVYCILRPAVNNCLIYELLQRSDYQPKRECDFTLVPASSLITVIMKMGPVRTL